MCTVAMAQEMELQGGFDAPDFENAMFSVPHVEISTAAPHRINYASTEWLDLFQFSREEIAGRTLRIVFGPCTCLKELQRVIETAAHGKEAQATLTCYSSAGQGKNVAIKASPIGMDGSACNLTMILSDAISFKDASMAEDAPRAIIALGQRQVVEFVNSRFTYEFGIPASMAFKALRMIQGPRTDAAQFIQAMNETKAGFVQRLQTYVYTSECRESLCDVQLQPLLGNNGEISHLVAIFFPLEEFTTAPADFPSAHQSAQVFSAEPAMLPAKSCWEPTAATATDPYQLPAIPESPPGHNHERGSSVPLAFDFGAFQEALVPFETPSSGASPSEESPSPAGEAATASGSVPRTSLKLVPRKKRDFSGKSSGAFELTTEKLKEMGRISMKQAAAELGIAPSTLKKACRKLGVERWPHGSHGGSKSKGSMDYDGSYVRRLFAKYSRKADGTEASSPSDAEPEEPAGFATAGPSWQAAQYEGYAPQQQQYVDVKPAPYNLHCQGFHVEDPAPFFSAFQPAPAVYDGY